MLSCEKNAATADRSLSTYNVFDKIHFDYLKVYYHISPEQELEQMLVLLISDIPSYDFPGLNVNFLRGHSSDENLTRLWYYLWQTASD